MSAPLAVYNLDRRITIQVRSAARDAANGQSDVWLDFATGIAANRDDSKGTRYDSMFAGAQINSVLRTFFTVRWNRKLAALDSINQRIVHEGRVFKMCGQPVEPAGAARRTYLQFFAEAGEVKL